MFIIFGMEGSILTARCRCGWLAGSPSPSLLRFVVQNHLRTIHQTTLKEAA